MSRSARRIERVDATEQHPREQGLKPLSGSASRQGLAATEQHPREQGLKLVGVRGPNAGQLGH